MKLGAVRVEFLNLFGSVFPEGFDFLHPGGTDIYGAIAGFD